ncbi:MAG TPA: exodeoxyribonuclease VII small subunit [Anaerolineaceae bacterium]|jgi:exodeoxyribonuclease VII small subunit|nr:exodeoxyribonuclease VII small subunit [Anaerolineaceae bacterium]
MTDQPTPSFEAAFASLQQIITQLENTELPLEEALKLYEEGKRLSDICSQLLETAQLRVETLSSTSANTDGEPA